jgi:hypothetical protein
LYDIVYYTLYWDGPCVLVVHDPFTEESTFAYGEEPDEMTLTKLKLML